MDPSEEKDKEERTRQRRETGKVPDPVRIVEKKGRGKSLVLDAAETILEEDCSSVLFDDPSTATVSDPVTEASAADAVKQSVARHRVGNSTILEESCLSTSSDILMLFDGSVSASSGAMKPLVQKLNMLLAPAQEYSSLPERIKDRVHLLKDDVEEISSYIDELLEVEDPPPMAICWMNEARGLSYDMEDYIDSLFVSPNRFNKNKRKKKIKKKLKWYKQVAYVVQLSEHGSNISKIIHVNVPRLPSKPKIAKKISEFRIYIQEAIERYHRYRLQCCSTLRRRFLSTGSMLPVPYEEAAEIVIDDRMNEFINSLATNDAADQQQLKVVSILGSGCLGKTTLAKVLYSRIGMQFDCRAFIKVSKKPDMKTLFHDLFSQLHQKQQSLPDNCNELGISDNTNKHLQDKRYLVVIDDLWDTSVWDIIKYAFPKGNHGSKIIITTQIEDVAVACSSVHSEHIFQMRRLDDDHSRKLFFHRLFGSENDCPMEFKQVSNEIIDICGGLPLATINIASHLANQQTAVSLDLLTYICDSLRSHLWSSSTSERTRQVLNLSYNNLPHYLKTCLLYLHMYAEGSIMWKDDLVKQWVAEGFIATRIGKEQDQEMIEKVAGIYFDALIDRRFIQPLYVNEENKVLSCTVHDVVRDLIAHKSEEENFIVLVDCNRKNIALSHKVRRLSLVFGNGKYAKTPANNRNTQIRSLRFFGLFKCMPCIRRFKVLRVLNLQLSGHHGNHDPIDLTGISELFQLRYLKVASDVCIKLPNLMQELQYLETMDVMDATRVIAIPWDIIHLPHLLHLTLPADTNLLDWIGNNMRDSVISLWSLGRLHYLQDLRIASSSTHPPQHRERSMEALGSLIGGHGNLKTVVLAHGCPVKDTVIRGAPKVTILWDRMAPPPLLQRFECSPHSCIIFYRIPKWVTELGNLCILKISVKELQMVCVGILRGLPALTTLSLCVETAPVEPIIFYKAGFLVLKHFKLRFTSGIAWLKFEADAMPNLWILKLVFSAIPQMDQHQPIYSNQAPFEAYHGNALISIAHMPGLKKISAKFGGAAADVEYALRIGIKNHPSNPRIDVQLGDYSSYGDERREQKQRTDEVLEAKPDECHQPLEIPTDKRILSRSSESSSCLYDPEYDKQLDIPVDKRTLSRSSESSSCLYNPGAVGDPKRMRTGGSSMSSSSSSLGGGGAGSSVVEASRPVVGVVDTQEAGIRLVHELLACAEAVQQENLSVAEALVKQIPLLAASQGGATRKVAAYFGEALARRIFRFHPQPDSSLLDAAFADLLHAHFYESCPYLKFGHFTANQAILEAFAGCRRVHVVDLDIKQGMQWPALLQALALRPGGPPSFRLTGVGPPQPDETDALQQVGWKLAQFAHTVHVDFQYRGLVAATVADLEPFMLQPEGEEDPNEEPEVTAVNSVFEMHRLLALPGALEKVLGTVHAVRPKIVTMVEQEANHNSGSFLDRFTESLHYYSAMFDSLEGAGSGPSQVSSGPAAAAGTDQAMSEVYLGRQICNVVACEGAERTERHETLWQWQNRLGNAGFETVHLGYNAYKQASTLLGLFRGAHGYKVEEKEGCLTLGWHTRPLIATSAWRLAAPLSQVSESCVSTHHEHEAQSSLGSQAHLKQNVNER